MVVDDKPLISVVVPVFNVEKYLERCIDSILNQTYSNIEILLIDDGSTDSSGKICDKYATNYSNVYVYHQENQGLAAARNCGLSKCRGTYIGFVDSDDYISNDMYEYLYDKLIKHKAECARIKYILTSEEYAFLVNEVEKIDICIGEEILERYLTEGMVDSSYSVCCCLYVAGIIKNIRFPYGIVNEDIPFNFNALSKVKKMVYSSLPKYFYYRKGESITRGAFSNRDLDLFKSSKMLMEEAERHNDRIKKLAKAKYERSYFSILAKIAFYGSVESREVTCGIVNMCQTHLRKSCFFLLSMPLPLSRKILVLLFCFNYKFAKMLIITLKKIMNKGN